jgi:hypothetical protein
MRSAHTVVSNGPRRRYRGPLLWVDYLGMFASVRYRRIHGTTLNSILAFRIVDHTFRTALSIMGLSSY